MPFRKSHYAAGCCAGWSRRSADSEQQAIIDTGFPQPKLFARTPEIEGLSSVPQLANHDLPLEWVLEAMTKKAGMTKVEGLRDEIGGMFVSDSVIGVSSFVILEGRGTPDDGSRFNLS
jgi:hypothetical protein